jgi:hypothetical protein
MRIEGIELEPLTAEERARCKETLPVVPEGPGLVWRIVTRGSPPGVGRQTAWVATYNDAAMTQFGGWECLNPVEGREG